MRLSELENTVIRLIAQGMSYAEIANELHTDGLHVNNTCARIRQKTGIRSTKTPDGCQRFLAFLPIREAYRKKNPLTHQQESVLRLYAQGNSTYTIALAVGMRNVKNAKSVLSQGCKRIGIVNVTGDRRRQELADYFRKFDARDPMTDPMF